MFTGPVGPVEVFCYWPEAILGIFYWPGVSGSLFALSPENIINILPLTVKNDQYTVCDGPTCKGKETFPFAGAGWGGSEGQKIMYAGDFFNVFS